jgi:phenylacetate-CoA ligase
MAPQQMQRYQRTLLEPLLRHARAAVPFYRDTGRLAPLFRSDDSIDWDRWHDVPIMGRTDLQRDFERLKADSFPANHGRQYLMSSSGSTGQPVKIIQTDIAMRWVWTALRLRDFEWHGIDPTQRLAFLYSFEPAEFETTSSRLAPAWRPEFAAMGLAGERIDIPDWRPATELVDAVAAAKPAYLQVQPTALQLMVSCDAPRLAALGLRSIFTYGEEFPAATKRHVEERLGCKVLELYGSSECNYIAGACPHCGNFHIQAEANLVEAVDDLDRPVRAGEQGRLLVTPFYNYAMPLIRYDHEDFAVTADSECPIKLPALTSILGKMRDPLIFPNGHVIRPTSPTDDIIKLLGARAIQIAQVGPDRCEVRIAPGSLPPEQMQFEEMTTVFRQHFWSGLQVDYRIVDGFPRPTPRAKFKDIKQEYYNPSDYLAV